MSDNAESDVLDAIAALEDEDDDIARLVDWQLEGYTITDIERMRTALRSDRDAMREMPVDFDPVRRQMDHIQRVIDELRQLGVM